MTEADIMTTREKDLMKEYMRNSILFQNLDNKDEEIIMKAMTIREVHEYELVIKEGEQGNNFYVVSEGEYDCYKVIDGHNVLVKKYQPG